MEKRKSTRRTKNLVVICTLTAIILVVSTYAWFIGMRSVAVSSFDVEIATTDSLLLSLDGAKWSTNVNINADNFNDTENTVYDNHTNAWSQLIPMSSIGEMDSSVSRMKLFEKASFTETEGGYRLMASSVNNFGSNPEQEGYVVFDLFVKNFSGTQYLPELNQLDEEAIYLTRDSKVSVASDGVANTGIENSVRVAFTQIGRVAGTTTDPDNITSIKCTSDSTNESTGICRDAQIWEPNDKDHVEAALNWYSTACKKRTGTEVNLASSYTSDPCQTLANNTAYPTYAIKDNIASSDNIDIYDGGTNIYNGYPANSVKVYNFPYFTDTMKEKRGVDRPQFMTLAPNSITKLRIYIYIEGQDVDNYDFAQIGKKIAVNFGFTKERFDDKDNNYNVDYTGPSLNVPTPNNEIVANHVDLANNKVNG